MSTVRLDNVPWPVAAAVVALIGLVLYRAAGGSATDAGVALGGAAVDVAGGVVAGTAYGIGDAIGVPRTDETECQKAIREGRSWDASFACPASDWIKYMWGGANVTD